LKSILAFDIHCEPLFHNSRKVRTLSFLVGSFG
jgi:hypothetical protein